MSYDNRNRQTLDSWSDGTAGAASTHDLAGRFLTLNNVNSNVTYAYDDAGQLLSEKQDIAGAAISGTTVACTYDADGNRAESFRMIGVLRMHRGPVFREGDFLRPVFLRFLLA